MYGKYIEFMHRTYYHIVCKRVCEYAADIVRPRMCVRIMCVYVWTFTNLCASLNMSKWSTNFDQALFNELIKEIKI